MAGAGRFSRLPPQVQDKIFSLQVQGVSRRRVQRWGGRCRPLTAASAGLMTAATLVGLAFAYLRDRALNTALNILLLTLGVGTMVILVLFSSQLGARFERDASAVARAVELRLAAHLDALEAMHSVYLASTSVTADEFHRGTSVWLRKQPGIQALGWHERVPREALAAFEAAARADGLIDYRVFEREPLAVADTDVYAMRRVEPLAGNETALGINALSILTEILPPLPMQVRAYRARARVGAKRHAQALWQHLQQTSAG